MRLLRQAFVTSLLTVLPALAYAADINVSASAIQWNPSISYDRVILTVGGPDGFTLTREFDAGRLPALRPSDLGAKVDGSYTWQLRFVPRISDDVRQKLAAARAANDDAAIAHIEASLDHEKVEAGGFALRAGAFITGGPEAPAGRKVVANGLKPAPNDVVTPDDEIIQGSLCVGLDCVDNESFGFDTIRLKENNTRITFLDDSTSPGFPNNVWTLTANDSASGGLNKFSIDDVTGAKTPFTVVAGAPTDSMFLASTGKLGLGNNAPGLHIHITANDTPAIRQEQTNAGGFTAQTWDIGANEANWFVRDLTGGSRLPFRIRPGAPTSSIDISAAGNVGVGTASPARKLHVIGPSGPVTTFPTAQVGPLDVAVFENNGNSNLTIIGGTSSQSTVRFTRDGGSTFGYVRYLLGTDDLTFGTAGTDRLRISSTGQIGIGIVPTQAIQHSNGAFLSNGGVWTNASSRALKQDIRDLDSADAKKAFEQLAPVTYAYKAAPEEHHAGFIAEDSPDLVTSKDHKGMSAMDVAAVLTKVIKDQQSTIDALQKRVEQLEKKAGGPH
jgi:hypothetical protein